MPGLSLEKKLGRAIKNRLGLAQAFAFFYALVFEPEPRLIPPLGLVQFCFFSRVPEKADLAQKQLALSGLRQVFFFLCRLGLAEVRSLGETEFVLISDLIHFLATEELLLFFPKILSD